MLLVSTALLYHTDCNRWRVIISPGAYRLSQQVLGRFSGNTCLALDGLNLLPVRAPLLLDLSNVCLEELVSNKCVGEGRCCYGDREKRVASRALPEDYEIIEDCVSYRNNQTVTRHHKEVSTRTVPPLPSLRTIPLQSLGCWIDGRVVWSVRRWS